MEVVTKIAPLALALIMLALGLGLTVQDFLRVVKQPKDFLVGLICQLILLPFVAFLLLKIFNLPTEIALGVMIIAAAPGGVTSNALTKFSNGDVALSISLTAIISLISIFSVPFIVFKSAEFLKVSVISKDISMIGISMKMFLVVTMPVIIGMIIRKFASNFVISRSKLIERFSVLLFVIVFAAIWIEEWKNILSYVQQAGLITLVLNISMMIIGYYVAKLLASGIEQRKSISLECGLQNGTLAVFVSSQLFNDITYLIPTATYAIIMFLTSLFFVFFVRKIN